MRVALYYPWVYLTSGAERTILELTGGSRHQWTVFTNRFDPSTTFPGFLDRDVVQLDRIPVKRTPWAAAKGGLRLLTQRLPLKDYDALVVVCEGLGDLILLRNHRLPAICICLTPLRPVFDAAYRERCLRSKPVLERLVIRGGGALFRRLDAFAWRRYSRVIAISKEAKRRAVEGGLVSDGGIEVLHPGLGFQPPAPSGTFENFFFLPGRIMWTKNIELGIEAFLEFRRRCPERTDFRLVVAGIVDTKSEPYLARLKGMAAEAASSIEFRIHPTDQEMAALYKSCYATLFTAFNEDWGIVPLESNAFGKPVIAVNRGGPRESVADGVTGLLVEPRADLFADAMWRLADSPGFCRSLGEAGHEHVKKYSWTTFIDRIDNVVDSLACRYKPKPLTSAAGQRASFSN